MTVDAIEVMDIVQRELDLDDGEVTPESTSETVEGWDSLGHLRICMAVESAFGVKVPMARVGELASVPALVAFLAEPR